MPNAYPNLHGKGLVVHFVVEWSLSITCVSSSRDQEKYFLSHFRFLTGGVGVEKKKKKKQFSAIKDKITLSVTKHVE